MNLSPTKQGALAAAVFLAILAPAALAAEPFLEKIDLFESGKDGYSLYRIPGIVVTNKGTLLAYCEARKTGKSDWDTIDLMLRRSTDGGKTWSARQMIAHVDGPHKKNPVALAQKLANADDVTYNNPVAIVDSKSGAVHFLFCLEYNALLLPAQRRRRQDLHQTRRNHGGVRAIPQRLRLEGAGHRPRRTASSSANGRLVVAVWLSTGTGGHAHRPSVMSIIYSDDNGKTWQRGDIAVPNTPTHVNPNETVLVQLARRQRHAQHPQRSRRPIAG